MLIRSWARAGAGPYSLPYPGEAAGGMSVMGVAEAELAYAPPAVER